ncbi:MAG: YfgM family protein [Pontibacterium sp.]
MAELRTEEEQVQAIKAWWKKNGFSLVAGIAIAVAIIFGWKAWQKHEANTAEAASVTYENLLEASANLLNKPVMDDSLFATAKAHNITLKEEFGDSAYAFLGALVQARLYVQKGELDAALTELDWIINKAPDTEFGIIAKTRKARVLLGKGEKDQALTLVSGLKSAAYQASIDELKGDIYMSLGDRDNARSAYQSAAQASEVSGARPFLTMKLNDLTKE